VDIVWVDNSTNEDGFRIERSRDAGATWELLRTLSANLRYVQDYQVALEESVCYRVFAYNGHGDSAPSNLDCTAIPKAPTDLRASAVDSAIELAWTDNSLVEDGYQVWKWDGVVAWHVVAQVPANSATYRDLDVTTDLTYQYSVRATRDGGYSYESNRVNSVVATFPPAAPGAVHPVPWGSTQVGVTFDDQSTNEEGFRVERSTDGEANWATVGTTSGAPYYPDQFVDPGRTSEEQVCYRAIAYNSLGDSVPSETGCTTPPAAPTNLTATATAEGVQLNWTDNSNVEDAYWVVLITDCQEQPDVWYELPPNSTSYLDTSGGWCFGPTLNYYVVASKDGGWSDSSNPAY
jgi:hypothetical protein